MGKHKDILLFGNRSNIATNDALIVTGIFSIITGVITLIVGEYRGHKTLDGFYCTESNDIVNDIFEKINK